MFKPIRKGRDYDPAVARIAGSIFGGMLCSPRHSDYRRQQMVEESVVLARAIVDEVRRTEPSAVPVPLGNHPIGNQGQP